MSGDASCCFRAAGPNVTNMTAWIGCVGGPSPGRHLGLRRFRDVVHSVVNLDPETRCVRFSSSPLSQTFPGALTLSDADSWGFVGLFRPPSHGRCGISILASRRPFTTASPSE